MPLKLLQAEFTKMIDCLSHEKIIFLNGKYNQKHIQDEIV